MSMTLTLKPRMSEKTYASSMATNTFVFTVPKSSNKIEIGEAVAEQFKVAVVSVRTTTIKGKKPAPSDSVISAKASWATVVL